MKSTAAVFIGHGKKLVVDEIEIPDPRPDQVIVKLHSSGVCHSQLHQMHNTKTATPALLGHEGTGTVTAVGSEVTHVKPGDLSIVTWVPREPIAGRWTPGMSGATYHEEELNYATMTWGEDVLVWGGYVVKIDDDSPKDVSSIVGCAILTGAGAVLHGLHATHELHRGNAEHHLGHVDDRHREDRGDGLVSRRPGPDYRDDSGEPLMRPVLRRLLARLLRDESGVTLAELLVSIGILTVVVGMVGSTMWHSTQIHDRVLGDGVAINELRNGLSLFADDVKSAQSSDLPTDSSPATSVTLSWTDEYNDVVTPHSSVYALSGTKLVRTYDGVDTVVARGVASVSFSLTTKTINASIEVNATDGATTTLSLNTVMKAEGVTPG